MPDPDTPVPAEFTPTVTPRPNALPNHMDLGLKYWDIVGITGGPDQPDINPTIQWAHTSSELGEECGAPSSRVYLYAAAGVEATLDRYACPTCEEPVALKSRTT